MSDKSQFKQRLDQLLTRTLTKSTTKEEQKDYWIVLSFDALSNRDFSTLKQHPNFNKLISNGSFSKSVRGVYPSLTYPSHASVLTGRMPRKHGIVSNTKLQPTKKEPDWYWSHKAIHGKTLFTEAQEANLQVASILWPVSGHAPISYNLPEVFSNKPWLSQTAVSLYYGSRRYQWQMNERHGALRSGLSQPELDSFAHAVALDTFKTYRPNLMFVHYTDLDTQKHHHGMDSSQAKEAIKRLDQKLGDYFKLIKNMGMEGQVKLLVFGDHGSRDVHTAIRPNVILQKEGFLSVEENGRLHRCDFIFKTCDGSAYLYHDNMHKVTRTVLRQEVDVIETALEKHNAEFLGIQQMVRGSEAGYEGADPHALLMLEANEGFYFLEDYTGDQVEAVPSESVGENHWLKATHGYHPDTAEDYKSVCFFWGEGIHKKEMGEISLLDLGPTLAKALHLNLGETDGVALF